MKYIKKLGIILLLVSISTFGGLTTKYIDAREPIMEYRYTIEEAKIKRAKFIWTSCLEEMRRDNLLKSEDIKEINNYINKLKYIKNSQNKEKRYLKEKNALKVSTVDKLVEEGLINSSQGKILRKKLNKYDLSNLEN